MPTNLKIKKLSAADQVSDKIKSLVMNGTWRPGYKLPAEKDLAEQFGVNRLTVRIALQRFNALGVLETRVGEGTFVRDFDFAQHVSELSDFYMTQEVMGAVQEFRSILELEVARLAIERQTPEALERLEASCRAFEEEVARFYTLQNKEEKQRSFIRTVDIGIDFHNALFSMAGNELFVLAFSIAKEPIRRHMLVNAAQRVSDLAGDKSRAWVKAYWGAFNAIKAGELEACRQCLRMLIEN